MNTIAPLDLHADAMSDWMRLWAPEGKVPAGDEEPALSALIETMAAIGVSHKGARDACSRVQDMCEIRVDEERIGSWLQAAYGKDTATGDTHPEANKRKRKERKPLPPGDRPKLTDVGNALRFVAQHGTAVRYLAPMRRWYLWNGRRWAVDERGAVMALARQTAFSIWTEVTQAATKEECEAIASWAARSESAPKLDAMVKLAATDPAVVVVPGDLDRDSWLFNVRNGTIDLRTGELREHRRDDLITKIADIDFDPHAECPRWRRFLFEVFRDDEDLYLFLQRAVGYSLLGERTERAMMLLHGMGANGKSVMLETLLAMFGDYGAATPPETLLAKKGDSIPNDLARLLGVRFVMAQETGDGRRFDAAKLKAMTGRDTICARFMRAEWFEFKPSFQLWLATNHRPTCDGSDQALFDRIKLVPFERRFEEAEQDKELAAKLAAELPGILGWAVAGCVMWHEEGLAAPAAVTSATSQYRSEMDTVRRFFDECAELNPAAVTSAKDVYSKYKSWVEAQGEHAMSQRKLGERLGRLGLVAGKGTGGTRQWTGVELVA